MIKFFNWISVRENDQAFQSSLDTNPADFSKWLVYADWLEERGDPRGAQIRAKVQEIETLMQGNDPKGQLLRTIIQQIQSPTRARDINHMGERRLNTYGAWTRAVKTFYPGATIHRDGNREEGYTANAIFGTMPGGIGVGEWDGESGYIAKPQQILQVIMKHGFTS